MLTEEQAAADYADADAAARWVRGAMPKNRSG